MILKKNYIGLFIIPQLLFVQYISNYPELIEKYYSLWLYQYFSFFTRSISSILPFSLGDILYIIIVLSIGFRLYKKVIQKQFSVFVFFNYSLYYISIIHFIFYLQWGLNYHRTPIQEKLFIESTYTIDDLKKISKELIIKANYIVK